MNLEKFNRQHMTIMTEVNFIENEVKRGIQVSNVTEIAFHISKLAGHIKMHLLEEDKFLYPDLLGCDDKDIQAMAKEYIDEMGGLASHYTEYKNNYNVGSKILGNVDNFIADTITTMEALKKRITKEEDGLYQLMNEKNLKK